MGMISVQPAQETFIGGSRKPAEEDEGLRVGLSESCQKQAVLDCRQF